MNEFLAKNTPVIRAGVDHHNATCGVPARAILLHPAEHARLGVSSLWNLDVLADERVRLGRFCVDCEGSAWRVEDELLLYIETSSVKERKIPAPQTEQPLAARR